MDKLAARATELSRQIYASLPWGYRLANLFHKLAFSIQEIFGKFAYAKFIQSGVEGLPDINGKPALDMRAVVQGPRAESKLPNGYGREFGSKVWKVGLSKLRNPEIVEEAISAVTLKMVSGQLRIDDGTNLTRAESLIITSVLNAGTDVLRKKYRDPSGQMPTTDEGVEVDFADPKSFRKIEDILSPGEMGKMMKEIDRVHPRATEWVEAILEGVSKRELADQWGVTPAAITNFENKYLDRIKKVVFNYLKDAA